MAHHDQLKHTLKTRHITMIALGGIIGAGLFVGSGAIIAQAGPAAILSYLIGGLIVTFVMFMLGEMAARSPDSGSFSAYARSHLGEWAGYTVGWLYWFHWMVSATLLALLTGRILNELFPMLSFEIATFAALILVILMNLYSVRVFAELEYWLSLIKVTAIVVFLILGVSILLGLQSGVPAPGLTNLTLAGGLMPNGISPVLAGVIVVIFAFGGSEIAAIAAGESEDPRKNVVKATRSVIGRVMFFYVGSVSILILCLPWTDKAALQSPYVALFSLAGFPAVAVAMNVVLLVAFLTVMNSGLYTASRMLFSLGQHGSAPALFGKTTKLGTPSNALMLSFVICSIILLTYFWTGGDFFLVLAASAGSLIIVVWLFIAFSHLAMRRKLSRAQLDAEQFKVWFYPYSNWLVIIALITVFLSQAMIADSRTAFWLTVAFVIVAVGSYFVRFLAKRIRRS